MPLIDERGRLFGRINLIDAIVVVVALALLPFAYGAFLLFRPQAPKIVSIEPNQILERQQATIRITGEAMRPFLVAKIGNRAEFGFLVENPTQGEIKVRNLPPGTYDLALLDRGQELVRKTAALKVVPLAPAPSDTGPSQPSQRTGLIALQALGRFVGLTKSDASLIRPGSRFDLSQGGGAGNEYPSVEVIAARPVETATRRLRTGSNRFVVVPSPGEYQIPATVRLRCVIADIDCKIGDTAVAEGAIVTLALQRPGSTDQTRPPAIQFEIDDVRLREIPGGLPPNAQKAWATLRVRFIAPPDLVEQLHVGDFDIPGDAAFDDDERATLTAIGSDRQPVTAGTSMGGVAIQQEMVAFTATVRVPVTFLGPGPTSSAGWLYKHRLIRIGLPFAFETVSGFMTGSIAGMQVGSEQRNAALNR